MKLMGPAATPVCASMLQSFAPVAGVVRAELLRRAAAVENHAAGSSERAAWPPLGRLTAPDFLLRDRIPGDEVALEAASRSFALVAIERGRCREVDADIRDQRRAVR